MMQPLQQQVQTQRPRPEQRDSPIVANPDQPVTDERVARLLFSAMVESPDVPAMLEPLIPALMADPDSQASHMQFIVGVVNSLAELAKAAPTEPTFVEWHRVAEANLQTTMDCANAYRSEGMENPGSVWFPMPSQPNNPQSVYEELPWSRRIPLVDRTTKIGSAGSCFASEISFRFQKEGYNYLVKERNPGGENGLDMASANWGIIFNVPSLRQLVERSFGVRKEPALVWQHESPQGTVYRDPWREQVEYASKEEYQESWGNHLRASREVFEEVDVFVMTLGLNEVWELRSDGTAFARCPWQLSPALVRYRTPSVEENLEHLEAMWRLWKQHNPKVQLILSVSPVPLLATFRSPDQHVITANCSSKATMRLVAEQFAARHEDVHYFPSFETVMYCSEERWQGDNRHVNRGAVGKVMALFDQMFMKEPPAQAAATGSTSNSQPTAQPPALPNQPSPSPTPGPVVSDAWTAGLQDEERQVAKLVAEAFAKEEHLLPADLRELLRTYARGMAHFAEHGTHDPDLYMAQRQLYTKTKGAFCDMISAGRSHVHPPKPLDPKASGILGELGSLDIEKIVETLNADGVAVFPNALPEDRCQELEAFARQHPVRPMREVGGFGAPQIFGEKGPDVTRYCICDEDVLQHPLLAQLAFDPTIVAAARSYLGCEPVAVHALLFWCRALFNEPDSFASQKFHFDMNRLSFLKAFIYLTDVNEKNGPHSYVRGSHHHKPDALWRDGRIPDEEIELHYPAQDILDITGKRGTLILADTRGFHRGKMLEEGERLIFHIEFADSMVGKAFEPCVVPAKPWQLQAAEQDPRLWHRYQLQQE